MALSMNLPEAADTQIVTTVTGNRHFRQLRSGDTVLSSVLVYDLQG